MMKNTGTNLEPGYTEEELYNIFCKFHDKPGALRLLADFMGVTDSEYARSMYERFKLRKAGVIK